MKYLILSLALMGCATTVPTTVELPLPGILNLPKVAGAELQCLSNDAYMRLTIGFRMLSERNKTLRKIIESTHE